jgi:2-polyprenyl-6-methoxyphenol hydroxylase-like FAD-dependent oxidoreductase
MKNQRIAIIGAGTAGLATAAFLGRQGHDVTVFERAQSLTAVGAGILLQPSGLGVLSRLGCLAHMEAFGHRINELDGRTNTGRVVMHVEYAHLEDECDVYGLGVHRAALCHVLDTALGAIPHKRWFGCEVASIEQNAQEAVVHFSVDQHVHREVFDAVLVANGSASRLRPHSLVRYDRQYPWGAMWLIRPLPDRLSGFNSPRLQQRYSGALKMAGILPTGLTPSDPSTPMLSFFWSLPVSEMPNWKAEAFNLPDWKQEVTGLWPELSVLVDPINTASELVPATYRDVILSRWGLGRIGVIGDAAHAMSPQLGQGANMALLDAAAIADALEASRDWGDVWTQFAAKRGGSIRFYQKMSRVLTPFFQSKIPGAGFVRDVSMPMLDQLPWLRRQMAETVAGRKQGWF